MRYETKKDLPRILRDVLPDHAQDLYLEAYQQAWDSYEDEEGGDLGRSGVAHQRGMSAVEIDYEKVGSTWHRKGEKAEEAKPEEHKGILETISDIF